MTTDAAASITDAPMTAATIPLDQTSTQRLEAAGLEYRVVTGDAFDGFADAVDRGFLGERSAPERIQAWRESLDGERAIGVYDPRSPEPSTPVATTLAWVMDVTIDAGATLPMWSISEVTVAATHRRRGIARALLEGELRAAAGAGIPVAGLTVSEATIYGRYGFGIAAHTADWRIDTRRAGWIGPRPTEGERPGRLDHVEREALADDLATLNTRTTTRRPGDIAGWPTLWKELAGLKPGKPDLKVRGVRYTDADGTIRGVIAYTLEPNPEDFTRHTLNVRAALADGRDGYAAIWRYALEHDLVATVTASLRSLDEPLRWMIANQRALAVTERDHHWMRILDVERCLGARRFRVPGSVTFAVTDPLGIADGVWRLDVDPSGSPVVTREAADGAAGASPSARVGLGVSELSALLLGGVRASTLLAAGRIETDDETAAWLDLALAPVTAPVLSYWY